jgi:hypothetical protein
MGRAAYPQMDEVSCKHKQKIKKLHHRTYINAGSATKVMTGDKASDNDKLSISTYLSLFSLTQYYSI